MKPGWNTSTGSELNQFVSYLLLIWVLFDCLFFKVQIHLLDKNDPSKIFVTPEYQVVGFTVFFPLVNFFMLINLRIYK